MIKCPHCQETIRQNRAGKTKAGPQRYECIYCKRNYTPEPKAQGYPASMRQQASELHVDGGNLRRIARRLKEHRRTVSLWVQDHAEALPATPMPSKVKEAEMDEIFTFIGDKKTETAL